MRQSVSQEMSGDQENTTPVIAAEVPTSPVTASDEEVVRRRLCGQILRVFGDQMECIRCGQALRVMGDQLDLIYNLNRLLVECDANVDVLNQR